MTLTPRRGVFVVGLGADKVQNEDIHVQMLAESVHAILHEALENFRKQEPC
jgi:hypothetical protein